MPSSPDAAARGATCGLTLLAALLALALVVPRAGAAEAAPDAPAKKIVPVTIAPERAAQALKDSRAALDKSDWLKAGGLLEGLLDLGPNALSEDDRRTASAGLATCCLQLGDGAGAGRALAKRAGAAADDREKRLVVAAAEALRQSGGSRIGAKTVRTYEEAVAAAPEWKAQALLAVAKKMSANANLFGVAGYLDRIAKNCLDKLAEADGYVPNFSASRRREVLDPLIANLMGGARKAADLCTTERDWINKHRYLSLYGDDRTVDWMVRVKTYLSVRQEAEDALINLKTFGQKPGFADLVNAGEVSDLVKKLDDLRYFPGPGSPRGRLRILPRATGGAPSG
jgi:hypothetical protein